MRGENNRHRDWIHTIPENDPNTTILAEFLHAKHSVIWKNEIISMLDMIIIQKMELEEDNWYREGVTHYT
jgi:hypothetical protein